MFMENPFSFPNPPEDLEARIGEYRWRFLVHNHTKHELQIHDIHALNITLEYQMNVPTECTKDEVESQTIKPFRSSPHVFSFSTDRHTGEDNELYLRASFRVQVVERDSQGNRIKKPMFRMNFKEPIVPDRAPAAYDDETHGDEYPYGYMFRFPFWREGDVTLGLVVAEISDWDVDEKGNISVPRFGRPKHSIPYQKA